MKTKIVLGALVIVLLSACGQSPKPTMDMSVSPGGDPRVTVTRIAVIQDDLAYYSLRGVYVITDTKTGQEFIGVSGIGISELGSHQSGKTSQQDER